MSEEVWWVPQMLLKWSVMRAEVMGLQIPLNVGPKGSVGFLEVFDSREAAVAEYGEDAEIIAIRPLRIEVVKKGE